MLPKHLPEEHILCGSMLGPGTEGAVDKLLPQEQTLWHGAWARPTDANRQGWRLGRHRQFHRATSHRVFGLLVLSSQVERDGEAQTGRDGTQPQPLHGKQEPDCLLQ